jgi:anti-anti-sigma factor
MSALKVKADLDGRICVLTVTGDLDCLSVTGFLTHAARVADERAERFVLDLGGVTFLDAAGARALATATHFPPSSCPVIIRSLSAWARRVLDLMNLMDLDLRQEPGTGPEHRDMPVRQGTSDPISQPCARSGDQHVVDLHRDADPVRSRDLRLP